MNIFSRGDDDEAFAKWAQTTITKTMDDSVVTRAHTAPMSEISREELNAKLETIEVKMDARVESVSSKIDGFLGAQFERDKRLDAALAQIAKDHSETRAGISSMRTTLIITAVSTVIAIVLGVAAFNSALTANMMSAFQLGKSEQPSTPASAQPRAESPGFKNSIKPAT